MTTKVLSRKAVFTKGVLYTLLSPRLAADVKLDLIPLLVGLTEANFRERKQGIYDGLVALTRGKLAKDAKLDDVRLALDEVEKVGEPDAEDEEEGTEEEKKKAAADAEGEKEKEKEKADAEKKGMDARLASMVSREDMGVAIKTATDAEVRNQRAIRDAEKFVQPFVGELAMDAATPEDVYREALVAMGVKVDGVHPSAYRIILGMQPRPGSRRGQIVVDEGTRDSFAKMFPDAARLI